VNVEEVTHSIDKIEKGRTYVPVNKRTKEAFKVVTAERVTEAQCGDPASLQIAAAAVADQQRIWGLDSPKRTDLNNHDSIRVSVVHEQPLPIP
jgi:hypothetical protein